MSFNDEICTLFVVGFPNDFTEREFNNMFLFASGFEAASLKPQEHCQHDVDSSERPCQNCLTFKQQTIGFVKFINRTEAVKAQQFLNGKAADLEKQYILKVEFAKKNLHVKRQTPVVRRETPAPIDVSLCSGMYDAQPSDMNDCDNALTPASTGSFESKENPSSSSENLDKSWEAFVDKLVVSPDAFPPETEIDFSWPLHPNTNKTLNSVPKAPFDLHLALSSNPCKDISGVFKNSNHSDRVKKSLDDLLRYPQIIPTSVASAHVTPISTPTEPCFDTNLRTTRFSPFSALPSPTNNTFGDRNQASNFNNNKLTGLNFNASIPTPTSTFSPFGNTPSSFSTRRPATASSVAPISVPSTGPTPPNADCNPPCNTLYVGNLPPHANEEELRSIFNACHGYKRLCVRYKAGAYPRTGPMCFVEFEDEFDASEAMAAKNGTMLSNSEKGGIRLSFSKNPLGVRRQPPPTADSTSTTFGQTSIRNQAYLTNSKAFPSYSNPSTPMSAHPISSALREKIQTQWA